MMWVNLIVFFGVMYLMNYSIQWMLRRLLNVKKKKAFSYNHVNDLHKKLDWTIRIVTAIPPFILLILEVFSIIPILLIILGSLILSEGVRAFFEWKHSSEPKQSLLTLAQLFFMGAGAVVFFQTEMVQDLAIVFL